MMDYLLRYEPVELRELNGGGQALFKFENGYGASVVQSPFSYGGCEGLYELAVTRWYGSEIEGYELDFSTPITNDVIGWLDLEAVNNLLDQISNLPASPNRQLKSG